MIYYGFKNQPEKAILIQVYQTLLYFACMLPGVACAVLGIAMQQYGVVGVGGILLALSGIVIMYLALAFSQAFYLLHDFPDASAQALLKMSAKIMKGYKFKLFCLLCSFIPLLLFAFLSFGIGLLWVQPYMNAATAEFFLEVMRAREISPCVFWVCYMDEVIWKDKASVCWTGAFCRHIILAWQRALVMTKGDDRGKRNVPTGRCFGPGFRR